MARIAPLPFKARCAVVTGDEPAETRWVVRDLGAGRYQVRRAANMCARAVPLVIAVFSDRSRAIEWCANRADFRDLCYLEPEE
jgi:hypothetical protein